MQLIRERQHPRELKPFIRNQSSIPRFTQNVTRHHERTQWKDLFFTSLHRVPLLSPLPCPFPFSSSLLDSLLLFSSPSLPSNPPFSLTFSVLPSFPLLFVRSPRSLSIGRKAQGPGSGSKPFYVAFHCSSAELPAVVGL